MPMNDTRSATTTETARKRGRPSTYSEETAELIWQRLIEGESLRQICCDETMPSRRTVFQWLARYPDFARLYAAARQAQADGLAGQILEIAESEPDIARARLMIDARFALMAKLQPRTYR